MLPLSLDFYIVAFAVFSFLGWLIESIGVSIADGHWDNRGFLYGPICPIYGVGVVSALVVFDVFSVGESGLSWWEVFLIGMFGSAVIEYVTSYVLEKLFHARWWDYSNFKLNINGRICLVASLVFGVTAVVTAYFLVPICHQIFAIVPNPVWEAGSVLIAAYIGFDAALSASALTTLTQKVEKMTESLNQKADGIYTSAVKQATKAQSTSKALTQSFVNGLTRRERHILRIMPKLGTNKTMQLFTQLKETLTKLKNDDKQ